MPQETADPIGRARLVGIRTINTVLAVSAVDIGEHFMRFVDDAQIERFAVAKDRRSAFTPGASLPTM